ncbi:MAG: S-layer homology domain-containing protein [Clostridia bacterium]|nr:S-layer homology domain-containing protein [Clostridia bacterium]
MVKIKRLLAILIASAILCSICVINISAEEDTESVATEEVQVSSDTDVESETVQEESISPEIRKMMTVLKTFKIIPEYYDYNVPLTYEVTRSDFAVSVANLMGKTKYDGQEVYFYDVPKNYWAYNEISNLAAMGIINGSGDKTFNPGEPITKSAAYTMLLGAMGYREYAENSGGYPMGYNKVASKIKLSRGVSSKETVTMSDMLQILYNSLTINIMELGSVEGSAAIYKVSKNETLISVYRGIYYGEGNVNGANSITINGDLLTKDVTLIDSEEYNSKGFNMIDYLGERVGFFYEFNSSLGTRTLLWVEHKSSGKDVQTIIADKDASLDTDTFVYTYHENGNAYKISLSRSAVLIYNGGIVSSGYDKILNNKRYELRIVSNKGQQTLLVREYENYIVGNINSTDRIAYDKNRSQAFVNLDPNDYETFSLKRMGSEDMDFDDITNGSVLTVYLSKDTDKKHIEVYVSNNTAKGIVENIDSDKYTSITINGNKYRVDGNISTNSYSVGDDVTAYLNVYGEIVYIEANPGVSQGAFLLRAIYKERDDALYIKLLGEDSRIDRYKCAEKLVIDGKRFKEPEDAYNALLGDDTEMPAQFALIKKNSDGEIKEIDTETYYPTRETVNSLQVDVPFWDGTDKTYTQRFVRANANAARIGEKIVFDANTKVFVLPNVTDYSTAEEEKFFVTTGAKLTTVNDSRLYAQSYKTSERSGIAKYMILKDYDTSRVNAELPIIAQKITQAVNEDGNIVEVLKGYQGTAAVSIEASDSKSNLFSSKEILPGDIVSLTKDNYGNVTDCTIEYDYRTKIHKALTADPNAVVGMFVGYANDVVENVVKIGYGSGANFDYAINAMSTPVMIYDTSDPLHTVSTGSTGDIITYSDSSTKCSTVFIVTSRMQPKLFVVFK